MEAKKYVVGRLTVCYNKFFLMIDVKLFLFLVPVKFTVSQMHILLLGIIKGNAWMFDSESAMPHEMTS